MSAGKVLAAIIVGVAAGAAVGVLYAPAKGSVTRRRILRKSSAIADDVKEKFGEAKEKFGAAIDSASGYYESLKHSASDLAAALRIQ